MRVVWQGGQDGGVRFIVRILMASWNFEVFQLLPLFRARTRRRAGILLPGIMLIRSSVIRMRLVAMVIIIC